MASLCRDTRRFPLNLMRFCLPRLRILLAAFCLMGPFVCNWRAMLPAKDVEARLVAPGLLHEKAWRRIMDRNSGTMRALLGGTAAALCLASTLLVAACAAKEPYDFPVMRLTSAPATTASTQPSQ